MKVYQINGWRKTFINPKTDRGLSRYALFDKPLSPSPVSDRGNRLMVARGVPL
jgi:hypothetical protein